MATLIGGDGIEIESARLLQWKTISSISLALTAAQRRINRELKVLQMKNEKWQMGTETKRTCQLRRKRREKFRNGLLAISHTHTVSVRETISAYHHHRALWSSSGEENRVQPEGKTKWLQRRGSSGSIYLQWQSEQHPTSSTGILPYRRTTTTTTTTATTTALAVAQLPGHWQTMPLIALWQLHFTTLSVSLCS